MTVGHQLPAMRFGWHAKSFDPKMASIRLRLIEPMAFLRGRGFDIEAYRNDVGPQGYDVIIFSKSFSPEALQIAREARSMGRAVIFDMCDNLFEGKARTDKQRRLSRVREMMLLATHVTFSTPVLARQMQSIMPEILSKSYVIPDVIDCADCRQAQSPSHAEQRELAKLEQFLSRQQGALHCVWFGKSQGRLAGFAHLDAAVQQLQIFARRHPVTLTVISNARWRYWLAALNWKLPTHYMPWSLNTFDSALASHQVAIVPVEKNAYTVGKTVNRPATAIAAGLGVIADSIDAYEELREFIALDDWQGGLHRYLTQIPFHDHRLASARQYLHDRYGKAAVGQLWEALLRQISITSLLSHKAP